MDLLVIPTTREIIHHEHSLANGILVIRKVICSSSLKCFAVYFGCFVMVQPIDENAMPLFDWSTMCLMSIPIMLHLSTKTILRNSPAGAEAVRN